jgi:hypothetical protein
MFSLFKSIFSSDLTDSAQYPEKLLEEAMERAIEGVDARLRGLSGYRKRLRPSLIKAIDHVVDLIDQMPPAIDASRERYSQDPYLAATFSSAVALQRYFSNERAIHEYLDNLKGPRPGHIIGLLLMERSEKKVFTVDIQGEILRRDVPQTTISFTGHRLLDPTGSEEETRKQLRRRAFDHLIELALQDIINSQSERLDLEQQYTLLRRKLSTLEAEGWGLEEGGSTSSDHADAQIKLDEIEAQLEALPAKTELLNFNLDVLDGVFTNSQHKLYNNNVTVIVDRMNIKQNSVSETASELRWNELHSANGLVRTAMMVSYPTAQLLPRKKMTR